MKNHLVVSVLALSLFSVPTVFANPEGVDGGKRLERMKADLNLTSDQENQIKAVFEDTKSRVEAIKKEMHDKISAILTPEQREKHEKKISEWKEKKKEERKERRK